jgi:phosphoribosylglycinamide formyltransferase-1
MKKNKIMNIAVLASGNGTNFEQIAKAIKRGYIRANLKLLLTDKKDAFVRTRAKRFKIKDIFVNRNNFSSREKFDAELIKILYQEQIDLVILAGFMRILSAVFVAAFKNRIINIHPALLPAFKGANAIKQAFDSGVKVAGVTVHFVDTQVDHGQIILQQAIAINPKWSLGQLEKNIHKLEHQLFPKAIKLFTENKLKINQRHVQLIYR